MGLPSTYSSLITKNKKTLSAIIKEIIPRRIMIQKKFSLLVTVNKIEIITGTNKIESTTGYKKAMMISSKFESAFASKTKKIDGIKMTADTAHPKRIFFFVIFFLFDFKKIKSAQNMKIGAAR